MTGLSAIGSHPAFLGLVGLAGAGRAAGAIGQAALTAALPVAGAMVGALGTASDRWEIPVRLRLLLHCGIKWQTHRTVRLRRRHPRFVE